MKILVDTNILIDWISQKEGYYQNAREIVCLCASKKVEGCIAAHSITNLFYILRKYLGFEERKNIFDRISKIFTIVSVDKPKLQDAVGNAGFSDFEDCLQMECARSFGADMIVTRNISDFRNSSIPAIEPQGFIDEMTYLSTNFSN